MPRSRLILSIMILCCWLSHPALAQKKVPDGAKLFLLSGGRREHHGFREQALYLSQVLENTGRFQVTVGEEAAILESPALQKYDLVVAIADRRDEETKLTIPQQEALFAYVRSGHGYVAIHGADNAPQDWLPQWKEMLGGIYSHYGLPNGKALKGTFLVKITDPASPVTDGLKDFTLRDELYTNLQMQPDVHPLATIEYKGVVWPVAWTYTFGKGRVFHTSLGHRDFGPDKEDPLHDPNLGKLIVQGIEWVASGKSPAAATTRPSP